MSRVLFVAYYFPPAGGQGSPGSQRALKFARYLPDYGWQPVILTLNENAYPAGHTTRDASLAARVPEDLEIHRTTIYRPVTRMLRLRRRLIDAFRGPFASDERPVGGEGEGYMVGVEGRQGRSRYQILKDDITDLFEIPDQEIGWFLPALRRGYAVLDRDVDAIWATGKPWTGLLVGAALAKLTGKPLLADFRDPWLTNPFNLEVSALRGVADRRLERRVVQSSTKVLCNTEQVRGDFIERYPEVPSDRFVTLPNGLDPDEIVEQAPKLSPVSTFTLLHAGYFYLTRDPDALLRGLRRAIDVGGLDPKRIRLKQVGIVNVRYALHERLLELGLEDQVEVIDQVPRDECLRLMAAADCLVLMQPGTLQVPSKLYEYCLVGRPVLAVAASGSSTEALVRQESLGEIAEPDDVDGIAQAILRLHERWSADPNGYRIPQAAIDRFDIRGMTARLAELLTTVSATDADS